MIRTLTFDVDVDVAAWALALVLFGLGDVTTTVVGLSLGAIEANPAVGEPTLLAMVVAKAAVFGLAFLVYRRSPVATWGAPLALALLGAGIVGWNLAVLGVLLP